MADISSLVREARLPERQFPVCLRSDLVFSHEQMKDRLAELRKQNAKADSMTGGVSDEIQQLTTEITAVEEEAREGTVTLTLRALSRPVFRALIAAHPPRRDDDGEVLLQDAIGVNGATFYNALIRQVVVDPQIDDDTWRILLDEKLTDRQFNDLAEACWDLSRDKVDLPTKS